ncbi:MULTISPECIES: hypothetical protein [unclassified Streptomyces]|uniref:hypothetical protein n=1 Tax=unclassified Streptomyces TaxID=2593676 RepID=UPI000DB940B0|nr:MULTISPECIES: hypothetical protein [unclassified Streptomyces]MYT68425.1 hypothetical protein [Streptomyces sp. SID8367]RAJ86098.1 hypothetical protein K377_02940 [Streptomyces sp. PsTaAH-137]
MEPEAQYRLSISLDVQGSSRVPEAERPALRATLHSLARGAFEQARIAPDQYRADDRGDGLLALLAPHVPPTRVLGEWLEYLHQDLRAANRGRSQPVLLRAGLTIGPTTVDAHGWSGRSVDLACRIGNSSTAKSVLGAATGATLLVAVSDRLHQDAVVRGGRWVEPERYRRYEVPLQEGKQTVWMQVPGLAVPPEVPEAAEGAAARDSGREGREGGPSTPPPPAAAPYRTISHTGSGSVVSDVDHIGTLNIGRPADGER